MNNTETISSTYNCSVSERRARQIARQGLSEYLKIKKELENSGVWQEQLKRVKDKYSQQLQEAKFLTAKDWEILALMEFYDPETVEHCIATFQLLHQKLRRPLEIIPGQQKIVLAEILDPQNLEQVERATLLHDIGKVITIPPSVLHHHWSEQEWEEKAQEIVANLIEQKGSKEAARALKIPEHATENHQTVLAYLHYKGIRPLRIIAAREVLGPDQIQELERWGVSPDLTFREIIARHARASEQILNQAGFKDEAKLAAFHHSLDDEAKELSLQSPQEQMQYFSKPAFLAQLVKIADLQHALESERPYHPPFPKTQVMVFLIREAERGGLDPALVRAWIKDELGKIQDSLSDNKNDKNKEKIKRFLGES
ncbi:hypothetical protein D6821_00125 [Candidatus Parcubacteria bacterium]|nr:MAG: hypothetical protein D6821_00125 [Candidatus Parcubacteria bacterium]